MSGVTAASKPGGRSAAALGAGKLGMAVLQPLSIHEATAGPPLSLLVRSTTVVTWSIGIVRAETKIGLADLVYNIDRLIFHERRAATG